MPASIRIPEMGPAEPVDVPAGDAGRLAEFIHGYDRLLVFTGAGVSTPSGIPAYRDGSGRWLQRKPILYQHFMRCEHTRRSRWCTETRHGGARAGQFAGSRFGLPSGA